MAYEQSDPSKEPPRAFDQPNDQALQIEQALVGWQALQDAPNLVPYFLQQGEAGRKWLGDVCAKQVCDDFDRGWQSSEDYRKRRKKNYQLYTGHLQPRDLFKGCSNAHSPVMFERIHRLASNVFAEIMIDRETIFTVKPTGPDDYEQAEILTLHGNWQLRNELTDFVRQMERAVQEFFAGGSVFCHSYYDPVAKRNRHDVLNCEEFVLPYVWKTDQVDLSDVPWKVRIIRKYKHELRALAGGADPESAATGWAQVPQVLSKAPPSWDVLDSPNRDQAAAHEGVRSPTTDPTAPYVFLEYHGWMRMPGQEMPRPVCVTVSYPEKIVTKLYIREEEDWRDRARYDAQVGELERYQQDMQEMQAMQQQEADLQARLSAPDMDPFDATTMQEGMMQEEPIPHPEPPAWVAEGNVDEMGNPAPAPVRRVPVEMFSHGVCIDNPEGILGLSLGTMLAKMNEIVDASLNAFFDAAMLGNVWSLIVPDMLDLGSSSIAVEPGKIFKVKGAVAEKLKDQIMELRAAQANPQLFDFARYFTETADSAAAAPGVLSGEPGKSGETFRGLATRREQATKQLSAAGIRFIAFMDNIVRNNAKLNAIFLPEDQIIQVADHYTDVREYTVGPDGQPQADIHVGRDLYRRNYSVTFTADVRFASQTQRISEADEVLGMVTQIPPLQSNSALLYAAVAKALKARGQQDLIPMLGPAPPPPTVPMGMMPPPMPGMPGMGPPPPGGPPPPNGAEPPPADVPLPAGVTGGIQGPRPEVDAQ